MPLNLHTFLHTYSAVAGLLFLLTEYEDFSMLFLTLRLILDINKGPLSSLRGGLLSASIV